MRHDKNMIVHKSVHFFKKIIKKNLQTKKKKLNPLIKRFALVSMEVGFALRDLSKGLIFRSNEKK